MLYGLAGSTAFITPSSAYQWLSLDPSPFILKGILGDSDTEIAANDRIV